MTEREQIEQQIEISIDQAKEIIERKEKMERLLQNPDFKAVFSEGYFRDEAARLVSLLSDPEMRDQQKHEDLVNDMRGISSMQLYILNVRRLGVQMEQALKAHEEALEEIRTEEE
jgi:hypothetical protein